MIRRLLDIISLLLCCLLVACSDGVFYIDLGNHYAWLEDRIIVRIKEEKNNALYYDIIVRPQVLNYNYDDKYVIAYQVYDNSEYYDSCQKAEEKDSLFKQFAILKKIKYCYWIIDKETGQVLGPMKKVNFDKECSSLHVKVKMNHFFEEKYWEGMGMENSKPDSNAEIQRK